MDYKNSTKMSDAKFIDYFENRARETIETFGIVSKKDKILVAASGGKDSTVLLHLMKKFGYDVEAITINAHIGCYSDESLENLRKFCSEQKIRLHEISLRSEIGYSLCYIISALKQKGMNKSSCSVCGTIRRYLLNRHAKKHRANIVLTGHNLDDEADAMMLAMFSGNLRQIARIGPLTDFVSNSSFVKRGKPLYFLFEDEVERYSKIHNFPVKYEWCPCSAAGSRRFYYELSLNSGNKFNLVKNIVSELPKLKKHYASSGKMKRCIHCSEPSSNESCQVCNILLRLKDTKSVEEISPGKCS